MTDSASEIGRRAARGSITLAARNAIVQVFQIGSSLAIARFVDPEAFGAFALGLAGIGFARYLGDLGVANSFLARPTLAQRDLRAGALIAYTCSGACTALLFLTAPLLANLLQGPRITEEIIRALALVIAIDSLRFGAVVRLNRGLEFSRIGVLTLAETVALYVVQLACLLLGLGIWSLVAGQLARSVCGTALWCTRGGGVVAPMVSGPLGRIVRVSIPFQGPAILAGLVAFLLPVALATALDARDIGFWAWATVLSAPVAAVVTVISAVSLPTLARLRSVDPAAVDRAATMMLRSGVLIPAGLAGLLCGLAEPIVTLLFGSRWTPAVGAVQMNLVGVIPATFGFFVAAVLESEQRAKARLIAISISFLIGVPLAAACGAAWGPTGAAATTAVAIPVIDGIGLVLLAQITAWRPVWNAVATFTIVAVPSFVLSGWPDELGSLVGSALVAGVVMLLAIWVVDREACRIFLRFGPTLPAPIARALKI